MNYSKIYGQIICKAFNEDRKKVKGGTYYENHHILPKCLEGTNNKDNLILLTGREHFICHKLLVELYPENKKLKYSLWMMITKVGNYRYYNVSSTEYERAKIVISLEVSKNQTGRTRSLEWRINHGNSIRGEKHYLFGKHHSEESKQKSRGKHSKSRGPHSEKTLVLLRKPKADKSKYKHSDNWKIEHSIRMSGEGNSMFNKQQAKLKCEYCSKIIDAPNFSRWHFDNCKFKNS